MTKQMALEDFRAGFLVNWEETFEKVTGIFLDKGTSLFETLATISAVEASRPVGGGCANVAAQVNHATFYMSLMAREGRGEVDHAGWQRLVDDLHRASDEVKLFVSTYEDWDEEFIGDAFGMIAHCAYHLGEIRAGLCVIKGNRDQGA